MITNPFEFMKTELKLESRVNRGKADFKVPLLGAETVSVRPPTHHRKRGEWGGSRDKSKETMPSTVLIEMYSHRKMRQSIVFFSITMIGHHNQGSLLSTVFSWLTVSEFMTGWGRHGCRNSWALTSWSTIRSRERAKWEWLKAGPATHLLPQGNTS